LAQDAVKYALALQPSKQTMNINNQHSGYESEFTKFMQELKKSRPNLEQLQRQGRALLWDKEPRSLDEQDRTDASNVQQQAYVYQNKG
jgi:hypothetical protein